MREGDARITAELIRDLRDKEEVSDDLLRIGEKRNDWWNDWWKRDPYFIPVPTRPYGAFALQHFLCPDQHRPEYWPRFKETMQQFVSTDLIKLIFNYAHRSYLCCNVMELSLHVSSGCGELHFCFQMVPLTPKEMRNSFIQNLWKMFILDFGLDPLLPYPLDAMSGLRLVPADTQHIPKMVRTIADFLSIQDLAAAEAIPPPVAHALQTK